MIHTLLFITASMSIGFILWNIIYYHQMHCIVKIQYGILSAVDLMIILGVVGLILSFFK